MSEIIGGFGRGANPATSHGRIPDPKLSNFSELPAKKCNWRNPPLPWASACHASNKSL